MKIQQLPLPKSPRRSSARQLKIRFTVSHHMTVLGKGDGLANIACRSIWRTREASAGYGVDGAYVAQFLPDAVAAWATADFTGNHAGISIEHANATGGPDWKLSAETLLTGARLVAELHVRHGLGRPVKDVTMRRHSDFFPTACPGPYFDSGWNNYAHQAQQHYDRITNPTPERTWFDMATEADLKKAVREVLDEDPKLGEVWGAIRKGKTQKWRDGWLRSAILGIARRPEADVSLATDELAEAILQQLPPALASQVVDELAKRVQR